MNVNVYLRDNLLAIKSNMYVAPNIPEKKLNGAVLAYEFPGSPGAVIAIYDNTVFGSAKEGLLFTGENFYYRDSKGTKSCTWGEIASIKSNLIVIDAEKGKKKKTLTVERKDGTTIEVEGLLNDIYDKLVKILSEIINSDAEYSEQEQIVPVEKMAEEVKIAYGKIVVNMAYENDSKVDETELAEILLLMTRLGLSSESRMEIRSYLADSTSLAPTADLMGVISANAPPGQLKNIHISLAKDLLNVHMATEGNDLANMEFLRSHRSLFDISDDQVNLAVEAIRVDRQLLNEQVTDDQMVAMFKLMATKAASVGVPIAAVYISGSVIGLSAAGITSGLATLGMGGLLGMSSMVTGVGVAVLLGVGAYAGINKLSGASEVAKSKRREIMLTEVVRQTQKTISEFMEDMNFIVKKLNELIGRDNVKGEEIKRLTGLLTQLSGAGQVLTERSDQAQGNISMIHCAKSLDKEKLARLTREPTKRDFHDYIIEHYEIKTVQIEKPRPGENTTREELLLRENLNSRELENLAEAFEAIGYYDAGKVLKSKLSDIFG